MSILHFKSANKTDWTIAISSQKGFAISQKNSLDAFIFPEIAWVDRVKNSLEFVPGRIYLHPSDVDAVAAFIAAQSSNQPATGAQNDGTH